MKINITNLLLLFLISTFSLKSYSQITYEKGYFINNTGQKISCLIKNVDWKNNPTEFEYKLLDDNEIQKANIQSIKEFGIGEILKYTRQIVNIDRSSESINRLSKEKRALFEEEELFLKVLIEGKANLYLYEDGNLKRFFYNKDNFPIKQLIYKRYETIDNKIGINNAFRNQLWNDLKCSAFESKSYQNLDHKEKSMIEFFKSYNECEGEDYVIYWQKQERDLFDINIRPGINNSTLSIENSIPGLNDPSMTNEIGYRFGIEAEFIMPFNKNKWSIFFEPTYQYFKSEANLETQNVKIDYRSIELPVGVRYSFFLNENSKIFFNGAIILNLMEDLDIDFETVPNLKIRDINELAFGLGYKYLDKYSFELRFLSSSQVFRASSFTNSNNYAISAIFGYSIF